jgi:beta-lactamase class A
MTHYAQDHPGTFGVAFQELGGQNRSAAYNASHVFVTASTYKLFVAYGTLKRVDSGKWKWSDKNISAGRNLSTCFDDMIVKSDNACAEALLKKIGTTALTNEIQALGLSSSTFLHENIESTPNDLRSYLIMLQNGSLPVKATSRDRLLSAMKRNVYRQGIPAGASGTVADKVGFLWGLLHDAAIVYSPKGTYVLVIMTDGSSWANIADLTRQIESLR